MGMQTIINVAKRKWRLITSSSPLDHLLIFLPPPPVHALLVFASELQLDSLVQDPYHVHPRSLLPLTNRALPKGRLCPLLQHSRKALVFQRPRSFILAFRLGALRLNRLPFTYSYLLLLGYLPSTCSQHQHRHGSTG